MPTLQDNGASPEPRRRARPAGLSQDTIFLAERQDDGTDRVVNAIDGLRDKAPSAVILIGAVLVFFGVQAATTIYLVSGLLATRGVDLGEAADATKVVVSAGAAAGGTTTTIETAPLLAPAPPPEP